MNFTVSENNIPLVKIEEDFFNEKNIQFYVLRLDLVHPEISGNKFFKLKYNLKEAQNKGLNQLITFGGAYSNHIEATAIAGKIYGFKTIGVIRGEETNPLNPTLTKAVNYGMKLIYISREKYKAKADKTFLNDLLQQYDDAYILPEGGTNKLAVKGCSEIVNAIDIEFDVICAPCGTGGTLAGLISSVKEHQKVVGFPALKGGGFLQQEIEMLIENNSKKIRTKNWELINEYHFGGYAKTSNELIQFLKSFKQKHDILLDLIYTGKMMYGLYDRIKKTDDLNNKTIIAVHTGGTQGNKGFEERLNITI